MQSNTSITPFTYTFSSTSAFRSDNQATASPKSMQSTSRMYNDTRKDYKPISNTYWQKDSTQLPTGDFFHLQLEAEFHTADMFLVQSSQAGLAETPYQYATTLAQQRMSAMSRPGGGTGVIPNPPAPLEDSIGFMITLAFCYTFYRRFRLKHKVQK